MCTYVTRTAEVRGSGRLSREPVGADRAAAGRGDRDDWLRFDRAVVYFDHPQDVADEHALCLDLRTPSGDRVAVELDADSARALAESILATLADDEVVPLLA